MGWRCCEPGPDIWTLTQKEWGATEGYRTAEWDRQANALGRMVQEVHIG